MSKALTALKAEGKRVSERITELGAAIMDGDGGIKLAADEGVVTELKTLGEQLESIKAQVGVFDGAEVFLSGVKTGVATPPIPDGTEAERKSLIEQLMGERSEYKMERFTENLGRMYEGKADFTSTSTSTSGSLLAPDRLAPYFPNVRPLRVRDAFFMPGSTTLPMVEWFELTTETHNAAGVAEGGEKPEDEYQFTLRQSAVKTVATTLPVTNQMLSDYGQMVTQVENRMNQGLKFVEDVDLVWGASGGAGLTGIMNTTGVLDAATAITIEAGDTYLDIIRKMMTACSSGVGAIKEGHIPTAVGVTPLIKQEIDLLKDGDKNYIFAIVQTGGGMRVWGIDIVESNAFRNPADLNDHYILVGAKTAGQIWDREQANVAIGLVNDQFKHNMQTIRVEERLASGLYAPSSYCSYQIANVS